MEPIAVRYLMLWVLYPDHNVEASTGEWCMQTVHTAECLLQERSTCVLNFLAIFRSTPKYDNTLHSACV